MIVPLVMPTNSSMESVMRSFSEAATLQPAGLYRELLVPKRYNHLPSVQYMGATIAAPPEKELAPQKLKAALAVKFPLYFEDVRF